MVSSPVFLREEFVEWMLMLTFSLTYRLERVEANGNWLFPLDQITPIEIYV